MTLAELREMPDKIDVGGKNGHRIYESVFRSHGMLQKVKQLLMSETPVPAVIIEMIEDVMDAPSITRDMSPP